MSTHVHQEVVLSARPDQVFRTFMDEREHSAFTGSASKIDSRPGGLAEMHDGQIVARNIEVELDERIVQAWRVNAWDPGVYTLLRITFEAEGEATRVTLDQTGCPDGTADHLAEGWNQRYWRPLAAHFAT